MKIELCWNITARCNQSCRYCHRFLAPFDLSKEDNFKILDNIINCGIDNVTFTGGEALLIDYLDELLFICKQNNIKTKLITNGILLTEERFSKIKDNLDYLNLSINSVATCKNLNDLENLCQFLSDKNIYSWRIFKFMPLRELAKINQNEFEISQEEYDTLIQRLRLESNINILTRQIEDFETKYLLILANGDVFVTKNGNDLKISNALDESLKDVLLKIN